MKSTKIKKSGHYRYMGYVLINYGYHSPDKKGWWQAVDENGYADYSAHTKKELMGLIDYYNLKEIK